MRSKKTSIRLVQKYGICSAVVALAIMASLRGAGNAKAEDFTYPSMYNQGYFFQQFIKKKYLILVLVAQVTGKLRHIITMVEC
ncbi:hypothetical protein [Streptococcus equi]|uniref:hypothetical protein n=1 Tax=Streptococcus equi TaxID=1336 RepID=UPI001D18267F|nr:hypothetical protein [Streptococcus equi]